MPKPKVFATHGLFEDARKILDAACEVEYWTEPERPPREEVLRRVKDKEGLVCLLTEKVNEELLRVAPKLRITSNVAVGFDNIDVNACTKRGVVATNTPGVLDETTADFAWTLLMAVARRLGEGEQLVRSGNWKGWNLDQLCGADVWGKTLGIVGFGRIGRAVARRALGFQMKVIYTDAVRAPADAETAVKAEFRDVNALLAESDFISLHVPLLHETHGIFDQYFKGTGGRRGCTCCRPGKQEDRRSGTGCLRERAVHPSGTEESQRSARATSGLRFDRDSHQDGGHGREQCRSSFQGAAASKYAQP